MTREELDKEKEEIRLEVLELSKTSSGKRKFHSNLQKRIVTLKSDFHKLYGNCRGKAAEGKGFNTFIADLQIQPPLIYRWEKREKEIASIDLGSTETMDVVRERPESTSTSLEDKRVKLCIGISEMIRENGRTIITGPLGDDAWEKGCDLARKY